MIKGTVSQISININDKTISYLPAGQLKREKAVFKTNLFPDHVYDILTPEEVFLGSIMSYVTHRELFFKNTVSPKYRYPVVVIRDEAKKRYQNYGGFAELFYGIIKNETTQVKVMDFKKAVKLFKEKIQEKDRKIRKVVSKSDVYVYKIYNGEARFKNIEKKDAYIFTSYKELYVVVRKFSTIKDVKVEDV